MSTYGRISTSGRKSISGPKGWGRWPQDIPEDFEDRALIPGRKKIQVGLKGGPEDVSEDVKLCPSGPEYVREDKEHGRGGPEDVL